MSERKEFQLNDEQYQELLQACRPVPAIALHCGPISSPQENANRAWCALGQKLGFDGMTVMPSAKGERFFTALTTTYLKDPCVHCGVPHDDVPIGRCNGSARP